MKFAHILITFSSIIVFIIVTPAFARRSLIKKKKSNSFVPESFSSVRNSCFSTLCNATGPDYPEKHIAKELTKYKNTYKTLFGSVIEPVEEVLLVPKGVELNSEENLCATKRVTIYPKIAYDVNMQSRFIVNIKGHEQSVSFETCLHENKACELVDSTNVPYDYNVFCKQLYSAVKLMYLNEKGKLEFGQFSVPSACVCSYTKRFNMRRSVRVF